MDERIEQANDVSERAIFVGETDDLDAVERHLDAVDADVAMARGRLLHGRFLTDLASIVDPEEELNLFERAARLYRALGDSRGEAGALFWIGCFHQVVRHDNATADPVLRQAGELARGVDDFLTLSYVLRHLGIAAHAAGELASAQDMLERSTDLRRDAGFEAGVAANLVGLSYIAAAQGRLHDAQSLLSEADATAAASGAHAIRDQITEARRDLSG